jgi:hypothetical protein
VAREIRSGETSVPTIPKVLLDVAGRHPACVQSDHLLVETLEAPLVFLNQLRLEGALPIARNANPDGTRLGLYDLLAVTVAGVGGSSAPLLLVAQVLGDLGLEKPLHHRTFELGEHAVRPEQVLLRTGSGNERIDEFLLGNQPIPIGRLGLLFFSIRFHERLLSSRPPRQLTQVF